MAETSWRPVMGAAQRRRERRLRSWYRHEQQTVRMALATYSHHSALRGQKTARAGEEVNEVHFTATFRANPPPQAAGTEYFSLDVEDVHTVEQMGDCVAVVPSLDVPVPQMVDQPVVVLQGLDMSMPVEQGIEVPKITLEDRIPQRAVLRVPLPVEQLVEVPVPETVIVARGMSALGLDWCQVAAPGRGLL